MWKRTEGFLLTDLLFTLSAWLLIATLFIPLMMRLYTTSHAENIKYLASQLLYEELMASDRPQLPQLLLIDDISLRLFGQENEICVSYFYQQEVIICEKY